MMINNHKSGIRIRKSIRKQIFVISLTCTELTGEGYHAGAALPTYLTQSISERIFIVLYLKTVMESLFASIFC